AGPGPQADRQRARGLGADQRRTGRSAGAARRQATAPADGLHRLACRDRPRPGGHGALREPGDPGPRDRRRPCAGRQVRAVLDAQSRGRARRGASDPLRSLRGRPARVTRVFLLAGAVVVLDQITKAVALSRLLLGVPVSLVDNLLALTLVMNPGLAFGLLGGLPKALRWVVALVSLVAVIGVVRGALRVLAAGRPHGAGAMRAVF